MGVRSPHRIWSLKTRLGVLATLAAGSVALAAFLAFQILRQTESAVVEEASRQLATAGEQMAQRYHYLLGAFLQRNAPSLLAAHEETLLAQITEAALAGYQGVEGGFYAAAGDALLGYGFPTYQGTGKKTDVPPAERETIGRVVRRAFEEGRAVEEQIDAARDVILFHARPIAATGRPEGAVWLMHRLHGVRGAGRPLYGWGLITLLAAAAAITAWASLTVRQLSRGIEAIEAGALALERDLGAEVRPQGGAELHRIAAAINRLGWALQEQRDRQGRLGAELRRADKLAALGRLVAAVAHEVRNPLASIRLKVQRSLKALDNPQRLAQNFDVIQAEIDRLDRLVERLLQVAKPIQLHPAPVDLNQFAGERLELHRGRAESRGAELAFAPGPLPGPVPVDQERLGQVLDNLIANALEALPREGGQVTVATAAHPGDPRCVTLTVTDTGVGIPPGEMDRLFEPFYTTKDAGTGLGLFLAAEIVRAHGGEIALKSQPRAGTTVRMTLPC